MKNLFLFVLLLLNQQITYAQRNETKANDSNTPLHLLKADYPTPYGKPDVAALKGSSGMGVLLNNGSGTLCGIGNS